MSGIVSCCFIQPKSSLWTIYIKKKKVLGYPLDIRKKVHKLF